MKKKLNSLIAVALCALATCFVLVGCSPVSGGKNAKMVGYWELVSGTSGGLEITEDDVKTMSEEGSQCILHLGDDGKATLDLFGDIEDAAWDMDKATVDFDDEDGILMLSGDSLTLSNRNDDDEKLVFKKGDDSLKEKIKKDRKSQEESNESADVASGNDAKTESVAIDPVVTIADDETATITATARVVPASCSRLPTTVRPGSACICSTIPPSTAARMKTTSTGTSHRGRQPTRSALTTALLR